jgi:nucleotide-binding universal stress UspA family protein
MRTDTIVVGTDDTDSSMAAVQWAAREAVRRGSPLEIVHAFDWEWASARYDSSSQYVDVARELADAIVATAIEQARAAAPTVRVQANTRIGRPVPQLLERAADAELVVLGSRGRGGFASLLLGSVSQHVATHAPCSVAVVRGTGDTEGPVAVGVDDSTAAGLVLEAAFEAAASRGCPLAVVRTYLPLTPLWAANDVPPMDFDTPEQDAAEREGLDEQLAPWQEKFPDVAVETMLSHDSAAAVLTGVSHGAQLIVVGSRGHGTLAGTFLGSTGLQLLHHAACPVLVVRPHRANGSSR